MFSLTGGKNRENTGNLKLFILCTIPVHKFNICHNLFDRPKLAMFLHCSKHATQTKVCMIFSDAKFLGRGSGDPAQIGSPVRNFLLKGPLSECSKLGTSVSYSSTCIQ